MTSEKKWKKKSKEQVVSELKRRLKENYNRLRTSKKSDVSASRKNRERTKPELIMMEILDSLNVKYENEFPLKFANKFKVYDFCLHDYNILIEVDGDYFHGNLKKNKKVNKIQIDNMKNDIYKNWLAKKNKYLLLRFWQSDIEENRKIVIESILKNLNNQKLLLENKIG